MIFQQIAVRSPIARLDNPEEDNRSRVERYTASCSGKSGTWGGRAMSLSMAFLLTNNGCGESLTADDLVPTYYRIAYKVCFVLLLMYVANVRL